MTTPADPLALLRSHAYVRLLVVAAILGVPISAAAWSFLALVSYPIGCVSDTAAGSRTLAPIGG